MRWWLVVGLVGCGKGKVEGTTFEPHALTEGLGAVGSGTVTYTTKADGEAFVRYARDSAEALEQEGEYEESPRVKAGEPIELRGLRLGKTYFASVVIADGDKEKVSDPFEFTVAPPPEGIPVLGLNVPTTAESCLDGGYVLFNYIGNQKSGVAIVDREGQYVWAVASETPEQVGRARPGRDGQSVLWNIAHEYKADDIATIVRQPIDGSASTVTRTLNGHHDFVELPDGNLAWLGYDIRYVDLPDGSGQGCVAAEVLYEGAEGMAEGETPTEIWNTWDDYAPGIYEIPTEGQGFLKNYTCPDDPKQGTLEFQHANSLAYVDSQDAFYQYWRWLDTLVKISRDGELVWEWGGPNSTLQPVGDSAFHEHSHLSDLWSSGVLLYDNRNRTDGTRIVEYSFDDTSFTEGDTFYEGPFDDVLGDVRRMPVEGCDNLLVSFSKQARIAEMTRQGEIVWEVGAGIGQITGRVYFLPDLYDFSGLAYPE